MWSELAPNDLLRGLPFKSLGEKPLPAQHEVDKTVMALPFRLDLKDGNGIIGSGDWSGSISSGHSAVVACGEVVVKLPIGNLNREPFQLAEERLKVSKLFENISPATMVIVAADGENNPKPVVIQNRINGQPTCETPFKKLLKQTTLLEIRRVFSGAYQIFKETGLGDFAGQRFSSKFACRLLGSHPFWSDNFMISTEGRVSFVDNIPDCVVHDYSKLTGGKKYIFSFRLWAILKSLDLLIAISVLTSPQPRSYNSHRHERTKLIRV